MKKALNKAIILIFPLLVLSGCAKVEIPNVGLSGDGVNDSGAIQVSDVLEGEHLVAVLQKGELFVVDPEFPEPKSVINLADDEIPPTVDLFTFKVSPSKHYIVWYSPDKGVLKLNLISREIEVVYPPSEWLNKYPYIEFVNSEDRIAFIVSEGVEFVTVDLKSERVDSMRIPYPFGNIFRVSPNGEKILFIAGFGQSEEKPQYMITDFDGKNPKRFITNTAVNKRDLVSWLPDSSAVVIVVEGNELLQVSAKQANDQLAYYTHSNEAEIVDLTRIEEYFYIYTSDNKWHAIDTKTRKEAARVPLEIAEEIHRPKFYPWFDKSFLIVETLRLNPEQFNRLWKSNYIGVKKNVVDKYQEIKIEADTPEI